MVAWRGARESALAPLSIHLPTRCEGMDYDYSAKILVRGGTSVQTAEAAEAAIEAAVQAITSDVLRQGLRIGSEKTPLTSIPQIDHKKSPGRTSFA